MNDQALTSAGRVKIEEAVKKDLEFMTDFAQVGVAVTLEDVSRIKISITLLEKDNLTEKEFIYIWDSTKQELV